MGDYLDRRADPHNGYEPVDSSAAAIASQGMLRLGHYLTGAGDPAGDRYTRAGLTVLRTLLSDEYLSLDPDHEGILLHGVYHRPNGWDQAPNNNGVPSGESVMWGDYHLMEAALYAQRLSDGLPYLTFFGPVEELG
jgi:unsaturated chondroitin disaccharide hydrolase